MDLILSGVPSLPEHTKPIRELVKRSVGKSYCEAGSGWVPLPDWLENILASSLRYESAPGVVTVHSTGCHRHCLNTVKKKSKIRLTVCSLRRCFNSPLNELKRWAVDQQVCLEAGLDVKEADPGSVSVSGCRCGCSPVLSDCPAACCRGCCSDGQISAALMSSRSWLVDDDGRSRASEV